MPRPHRRVLCRGTRAWTRIWSPSRTTRSSSRARASSRRSRRAASSSSCRCPTSSPAAACCGRSRAIPELKLIRVCKEDECIGIASGLSYCDKRALTLIQYTGFLDSINAIRGVAVEYGQPICMMIGLLGHDPDTTPRNSPRYGVRIIEPILDAMGIPHHLVNEEADVGKDPPGDRRGLRQLASGCAPDRPEAVGVMMKRDECFRVLARHVTDEIVVSTYSSAVDWLDLGERTLNYFSVGAMGLDSSHALGLALGRPDKRIICLHGDGSLLMNLGLPRDHRGGRAEEPRPHRGAERHLRGQRRPSDPEHRGRVRRHGARGRLCRTCTTFRSSPISSSRPPMCSSRTGRCSRRCVSSRSKPLTYDYPKLYDPARRKALKAALQRVIGASCRSFRRCVAPSPLRTEGNARSLARTQLAAAAGAGSGTTRR